MAITPPFYPLASRAIASSPPIVLSFAASDPTCGAGLQADLLTIAAHGCQPLTVVTALTVQDTTGVENLLPSDAEWVAEQARTLLEDMPVAAFKLGMLGSVEVIAAIAEVLSDYPATPVVFDPVLASGRGDAFADEDAVAAMIDLLLPLTDILTPNSLEARRLAQELGTAKDLPECARLLVAAQCAHVLVTGTHEQSQRVVNTLYGSHGPIRRDEWDRLPGSYHGSGCTLASAIAANLAWGQPMAEAVRAAQHYTWHSLAAGFRPGMGQFIPNRLWRHGAGQPDMTKMTHTEEVAHAHAAR